MSSDTDQIVDPATYLTGVPHEAFARLRAEHAVVWMDEPPPGTGFWGVLRHAEIKEVLRDTTTYSSYAKATQMFDPPNERALEFIRQSLLNQDPPRHAQLRKLISRAFTPKAVARLEDRITGWANELVEEVAEDGACDFTWLVAELPLRTIAEIFGVPDQDRWLMNDWSNRIIGYQDPNYETRAKANAEGSTAMARRAMVLRPKADEQGRLPNQRTRAGMPDLFAYARDLVEWKREHPGEDVLSNLVHTGLPIAEFENMFWLFPLAGIDTLRNGLPGGMHTLLSQPDTYRAVRQDRTLLPGAVEEMLRWWSPIMHFRRTATVDTELGGQRIGAGDKVILWFVSGNRDERVFDDPDRFDITRTHHDHLAFGHGPHYCLGAHLVKVQMRAMFTAVFDRLGDVRSAGDIARLGSNFQNGVTHLPIRW